MTRRWISFFTALCAEPAVRGTATALYYLAILLGLVLVYGKGNFTPPKFIYEGF